jgi:hypothetical protein
MAENVIAGRESAFQALRWLAKPRPATEQCEFCSSLLDSAHRHLLEVSARRIVCACDPCALRFENAIGRWKLIPRDSFALPDFALTDAEWDALALPINLAFFFPSAAANRVVAMYPSPAGATESLLPLSSWEALVEANPVLNGLLPDVQALLMNRLGDTREYYLAPIDRCFELVGIIRMQWRGFSGGTNVWKEIAGFFEKLKSTAGNPAGFEKRTAEVQHA